MGKKGCIKRFYLCGLAKRGETQFSTASNLKEAKHFLTNGSKKAARGKRTRAAFTHSLLLPIEHQCFPVLLWSMGRIRERLSLTLLLPLGILL